MQLNFLQIKNILPHRYPFLFVDKVIDLDIIKKKIHAKKNITGNEDFFNGHFPENPIMPGVLVIEALAQTVSILGIKIIEISNEYNKKKMFLLAGINTFRMKKPVFPGDNLNLFAYIKSVKHGIYKSYAEAYHKKQLVAHVEFLAVYKKTLI